MDSEIPESELLGSDTFESESWGLEPESISNRVLDSLQLYFMVYQAKWLNLFYLSVCWTSGSTVSDSVVIWLFLEPELTNLALFKSVWHQKFWFGTFRKIWHFLALLKISWLQRKLFGTVINFWHFFGSFVKKESLIACLEKNVCHLCEDHKIWTLALLIEKKQKFEKNNLVCQICQNSC